MRISKKAEYALRALVQMARKPSTVTSSIDELSDGGRIPAKFLEQILLVLKRAEVLRSKRGVGGGYQLNRPPARISLAEIVFAIDGPFVPMSCTQADPAKSAAQACDCGITGGCGLGRAFTDLQMQVNSYLEHLSLADVVARESGGGAMHFDI